jgi:hypothetical protein
MIWRRAFSGAGVLVLACSGMARAGDHGLADGASLTGHCHVSGLVEARAEALAIDLSGRWLLTLPAGFQHRVTLEPAGPNQYRFAGGLVFAGVYELRGDCLAMVQPLDERLTIFDWRLDNVNCLTLVAETGKTGPRYVGATLGRQIDWDAESLNPRVPIVEQPARGPLGPVVRELPDRPAGREVMLEEGEINGANHGCCTLTDRSPPAIPRASR